MLLHTSCHIKQGIGDDLSTSAALRVKVICLSAYSTIIYYPVKVQCTLSLIFSTVGQTTFTCTHTWW